MTDCPVNNERKRSRIFRVVYNSNHVGACTSSSEPGHARRASVTEELCCCPSASLKAIESNAANMKRPAVGYPAVGCRRSSFVGGLFRKGRALSRSRRECIVPLLHVLDPLRVFYRDQAATFCDASAGCNCAAGTSSCYQPGGCNGLLQGN